MLLIAENIHKRYSINKESSLDVLKGVSVSFDEGEIVSVVGPSGAGKSTLIHILGLLDRPSEGTVNFQGIDYSNQSDENISKVRNQHIGFVFQFHHLLPEFTAIENIIMPALIAGEKYSANIEKAQSLLEDVGLLDRQHHKPSEMSGGEQQRIAVARALMNSPKIVFADEPSGNLDSENATRLHALIFDLRNKYKQSFVIVTHNKDLSTQSDRIITLVDGRLA
jgi:lipoprotein-releasing system ATP-binding protein